MTISTRFNVESGMMHGVSANDCRAEPQARASIAWVSVLKIVAIIAVITIHVTGETALAGRETGGSAGALAIVLDAASVFCVPVFVMVSGTLLLNPSRYPGPGPFLRKRALRLVPAVVFWHVAYWAFREFVLGWHTSVRETVTLILNGHLYTALYFFWIVLGLAVVAVVLVPWIASATNRAVVIGGTIALLMPVLSSMTTWITGTDVWVLTPWTWWIPYLGYFILGYGLRSLVLHGYGLLLAIGAAVAVAGCLAWLFYNPDAPTWFVRLAPHNYYSPLTATLSILVFVIGRSLVREGGALRGLTGPRVARLERTLADATLGVFALHLMVIKLVRSVLLSGEPVAGSPLVLLAEVAIVAVLTFAIVLPLRRVPFVRRVL